MTCINIFTGDLQNLPSIINADILLKQGTDSEFTANPLQTNEVGFSTTSNRLIVGSDYYAKINDLQNQTTSLDISYSGNLFRPFILISKNSLIQMTIGGVTSLISGKSIEILNTASYSEIVGYAGLTQLSFNDLQIITADINQSNAFNSLISLSFNQLKYIIGSILGNYQTVVNLNLPQLYFVGNNFSATFTSITSLNIPKVETIVGFFSPQISSCLSVSLPLLKVCGGINLVTSPLLTNFSIPLIQYSTNNILVNAANLTTFDLGSSLKGLAGNFTISGAKLNQASIDNILIRLAALDGTNGTINYSTGKTINLSGGTSSTPSATGLMAKAILISRGLTVTTN